jgi:regulatory protein
MAGTITALVAQKKNRNRVSVFLDGKFAFGLAAIEAARLRRGQALSDAEIDRLCRQDSVETAHERALRFLSFRPRSEAEVRRNLAEARVAPGEIDAVIERLKRVGLVDDRAFVQYWLENRGQFSPRSARALQAELRRKGIPVEAIDEALQATRHDEGAAALQAALPRARRLADLEPREFRQKLAAFLMRRGFDYQVTREAVSQAWQAMHGASPDSAFEPISED